MHALPLLVTIIITSLGIAVLPALEASTSTIHYRTRTEQYDDSVDEDEACDAEEEAEHKRWYQNHRYRDYYDDPDDPTEELEQDAAWPGKRDDSWDHLFR